MIAALDVYYSSSTATAAAILFEDWRAGEYVAKYKTVEPCLAEYEPGKFFLRELAPLLEVIRQIQEDVDTYVIDGYCHLSADLAPGLGAHLHHALHETASVVGVAKNRYQNSNHAIELCRASSKRPLFITAVGVDYATAANHVASMRGDFRTPTLLKAVDQLSRS